MKCKRNNNYFLIRNKIGCHIKWYTHICTTRPSTELHANFYLKKINTQNIFAQVISGSEGEMFLELGI